jgi:hypothetical protein
MKKIKIQSKLSFNKETISRLNTEGMEAIKGGAEAAKSTMGSTLSALCQNTTCLLRCGIKVGDDTGGDTGIAG